MRPGTLALVAIGALALLAFARLLMLARASHREPRAGLGLADGRLRACPSSPNCVVSEGADTAHAIEPLRIGATLDSTRAALRAALGSTAAELGWDMTIAVDEPAYLRATFRSRILRYDDDVELRIDMPAGVVHVRSASRVGHSDFGANRKRVEALRRAMGSGVIISPHSARRPGGAPSGAK